MELRSVKLCKQFDEIFPFQCKSRGTRIDLRTFIHGILHPSEIRQIITTAQKSRTLYFQLRVCFYFIDFYTSIRLIFATCTLRRILSGVRKPSVKEFNMWSIKKRKSDKFGKIVQKYLQTCIVRNFKLLRRAHTRLLENDGFHTQSIPYTDEYGKLLHSNLYHIS